MKKVLILSGSPRKGGNSDTLCDEFMKGAIESGNEVEKIFVAGKNIGYCKACYACKDSGVCVIKDDMAEVLQKVLKRAEFWQKNINVTFNDRQRKVLYRFMDDFEGNLTTTKWAKICNCSQDTATRDITDLIDKKILKKAGTGRSTHYLLK